MSKLYVAVVLVVLLLGGSVTSEFTGYNPVQNAAALSNANLFVSAENSQWNNYFAGPQVIQVIVADPDINRLDQAYGEPTVTVNGKKLRMAQATDGNWYAYFADSKQAQIADSTAPLAGKGLNFGEFCAATDGPAAVGVDFSETKGFAIASTAAGSIVTGSSNPSATIFGTSCAAAAGVTTEHVVRENKTLNPGNGNFIKIGQIGINPNAWPVIQLFDFSGIPSAVQVDYHKAGGDQVVNLTFDRIPTNLISTSLDRTSYTKNSQVFITMNDPQLNIDPTEEDSWTWGSNAANNTLYYQAFNRNGGADADGTAGMQNLIGNLTSFMFNHNGKLTVNPAASGTRVIDLQSNGKQVLTPGRGDPALVRTKSIGLNSEPITFIETGGVNTGVLANWDGGKKSNVVTLDSNTIRGQSASIGYNDISQSIVGGFGFASLSMLATNNTWASGQKIPVTLTDTDANKNSKITEHLDLFNPSVARLTTMKIGTPFTLQGGNATYFRTITTSSLGNGLFAISGLGTPSSTQDTSQDEQFSARSIFKSFSQVTLGNTGGILVSLKTTMQSLKNTIHNSAAGNAEGFKGFNFFNYDLRSLGFLGQSTGASITGVHAFLAYNSGSGKSPTFRLVSLANSTSLQDFVNLGVVSAKVSSPLKLNNNLFTIPSNATIALLFTFDTTGDVTLSSQGQPMVADFFSIGLIGDGKFSNQRINNGIYRWELEETGDNTSTFTGTNEFVMLNQLNIFNPNTYSTLRTINHDVKFAAIQDMLQADARAPQATYLDLGQDGVDTQISKQQDIPTHTGVVSFDSKTYKIADTVTITLNDADLNSDNDLVDIYTTVPSGGDPASDTVGKSGLGVYSDGTPFGRLFDIKFDNTRWAYTGCFGINSISGTAGGLPTSLFASGFSLVETGPSTGVLTGTFGFPDQYCSTPSTITSTKGKVLVAEYADFANDAGMFNVATSAANKPTAIQVKLDKNVYTWTDRVNIAVTAPDQNLDSNKIDTIGANNMSKITISTRGSTINNYKLVETGPNTGNFTGFVILTGDKNIKGSIGVDGKGKNPSGAGPSGIGPTDGLLPAENSDGVSVLLQTQSQTLNASALIRWNIGQISWIPSSDSSNGQRVLQIIDRDMNLNPNAIDTFSTPVFSNSDLAGVVLNMTEIQPNTGVFQGIVQFTNSTSSGNRLHISGGNATIIGEYTDRTLPSPYTTSDQIPMFSTTTVINGNTVPPQDKVKIDKNVYTWTDRVNIAVTAPDQNLDPNKIDVIGNNGLGKLTISTRGNTISQYKLIETGPNTGIFTGNVVLTGNPNLKDIGGVDGSGTQPTGAGPSGAGPTNGLLPAQNIDGISVTFQTPKQIVIATAPIQWNIGQVTWLPPTNPASGQATCLIADHDMNLNPLAIDQFRTNVWSISDSGGIKLTMTETGPSTGIFQGVVIFTNSSSSGNQLHVNPSDTLTCEYKDRTLPSPYTPADQLRQTSSIIISNVPPIEKVSASNPRIVDSFGNPIIGAVKTGQQIQIAADLTNNQNIDQAFVYLVQIQGQNGTTVSMSWITGTLVANMQLTPAQSWTPSAPGTFTAKIFVLQSIINPMLLSKPLAVTIMVQS